MGAMEAVCGLMDVAPSPSLVGPLGWMGVKGWGLAQGPLPPELSLSPQGPGSPSSRRAKGSGHVEGMGSVSLFIATPYATAKASISR